MNIEFHQYTLIDERGKAHKCYRAFSTNFKDYIDDREYTDCYMDEVTVRGFLLRVYRTLGGYPGKVDLKDFITIDESLGNIYEGDIKDYSPFKGKGQLIDFLKKNTDYDFKHHKSGFPAALPYLECTGRECIIEDSPAQKKYFADNHFYKDSFNSVKRRKVRRITTENIGLVDIIRLGSPFIETFLCSLNNCETFCEIPETDVNVRDIRNSLDELIPEFSKISGVDVEKVDVKFGPYPPTKAVINISHSADSTFNKENTSSLVETLQEKLADYSRFQETDKLPVNVKGYYFEINDVTGMKQLYVNGMINVDEKGSPIFG